VPHPADLVGPVLMGAALLATVVTGGDYVVQALRMRRDARSSREAPGAR
jgi:CDP-diacylglycerol--glycerol-3-phosphate 3-phosphatidyltransferase